MTTCIVQEGDSQLGLPVRGSRDGQDLIKTDGQDLVLDCFKHDVSLPAGWRGADINSQDVERLDSIVKRLSKIVSQPLISRFQSEDIALIFELLSMSEALFQIFVRRCKLAFPGIQTWVSKLERSPMDKGDTYAARRERRLKVRPGFVAQGLSLSRERALIKERIASCCTGR